MPRLTDNETAQIDDLCVRYNLTNPNSGVLEYQQWIEIGAALVRRVEMLSYRVGDLLDEVKTLREQLEQAVRERDEAREWVRKLQRDRQVLTCAFCGESYPPGTPNSGSEALTAHIKVCAKHPMREVERERDEARADRKVLAAEVIAKRQAFDGEAYDILSEYDTRSFEEQELDRRNRARLRDEDDRAEAATDASGALTRGDDNKKGQQ